MGHSPTMLNYATKHCKTCKQLGKQCVILRRSFKGPDTNFPLDYQEVC